MILLQCVIMGDPVGKGRPRFSRKTGRTYTPAKTREWEARMATTARVGWKGELGHEGPVEVIVRAYKRKPKAMKRAPEWRTVTPDADNCAKAAIDGLQNAGCIRNDSVVSRVVAESRWGCDDLGARVEVEVRGL